MKWTFFLFFLFFYPVAAFGHAMKISGFYLGANVGTSDSDYKSIRLYGPFQLRWAKGKGLALNLSGGYAFDRIAAFELGVIYLHRPVLYGIGPRPAGVNFNSVKQNVVYLVTRLGIPIGQFDIYARGGVGYVARGDITVWDNGTVIKALRAGEFGCAVYGVGVDYRVARHWGFDLRWLQTSSNHHHQLPLASFYGVGLFYQF